MKKHGKTKKQRLKERRKHLEARKRFSEKQRWEQKRIEREGGDKIAYRERDAALRTLGFESYTQYLESDLWKSIRRRVIERDKGRCRLCNGQAVQVHHRSYRIETLRGQDLQPLAAICCGCHMHIERKLDGSKRSCREVSRLFKVGAESLKRRLAVGVDINGRDREGLDAEFREIVRG